uniref:EF-hand domain-containing protein n=2 Tax=Lotharella globosa TaxID=91324 RepID=A0A6V3KK52_9EUKA|mmetsp:Transcript_9003/g.17558  ORF Transcript_9003/g.17558 Transcript_9003/m.17558 type:complete len:290 (-) Transcript_9003:27-896(-)
MVASCPRHGVVIMLLPLALASTANGRGMLRQRCSNTRKFPFRIHSSLKSRSSRVGAAAGQPSMQEMLSRVQLSSSEEHRIRENLRSCWPQLPAEAGAGMVEMFRLGVASLMDEEDQKSRSINMARLKERLDAARQAGLAHDSPVPQGLACDTKILGETLLMFDRNGDGEIDFIEACECFMFYAEIGLGRSVDEQQRMVFSLMDEDNDQKVTLKELRSFVRMALRTGLIGDEQLERLVDEGEDATVEAIANKYLALMDLDRDSTISFQEFQILGKGALNWDVFSKRICST